MQPMINTLLDPVVNFGKVTVSGGYTSTATEVALITGDGSKLPNPVPSGSFNLVWFNNSTYSDPADDPYVEIVRCIARVDDTLTLMRHQEGTSASDKNIPTKIYKMILSPTKKTIDDIQTESQSKVNTHSLLSTGVHGVGLDTIDGIGTRNVAISAHSSVTSNVHGFNASGDAPAQTHGISRHTGTIGDHAANLSSIGTNTHAQIDTAISNSTSHIIAAAPHSGHDTPAQRDIAINTAIDTHKNLITGVHGVTGSYILGTEDIGVANGVAGLDTSGKVPISQLPTLAAGAPALFYGYGYDGAAIIGTNTDLSRDMFYTNLTVNGGVTLNTKGYRIFVSGTLINNGTITNPGTVGSAPTGGAGAPVGTLNGGGVGGNGGGSGTGATGGGGGGGGGILWIQAKTLTNNGTISAPGGNGGNSAVAGGSGPGYAGASISNSLGGSGGVSGYGGAAGGITTLSKSLPYSLSSILTSGAGVLGIYAGGGGGGGGHADTSNRGGGGGGGGGGIVLIYTTKTASGTVTAPGGTGGTNYSGGPGATGSSGNIYEIVA